MVSALNWLFVLYTYVHLLGGTLLAEFIKQFLKDQNGSS